MRARIWGCRGSLAAPGADTVRYGGNTSCVEVRLEDGTLLVLDAGTGIRPFGLQLDLEPGRPIHVLLSHLHLDHLQGLGFFSPIWSRDYDLHIWGPPSPLSSLAERVARYLSPPLFPVHLAEIPSQPTFHDAPKGEWEIGSARLFSEPVSHQGPTVGYRIEENGRGLAYLPDHEPALGTDLRATEPAWVSGYGVAAQADVLLHDAQYTEEEYRERVGWGHSSIAHAVTFGRLAGAGTLVMFHHDPLHTDERLEELLEEAKRLWNGAPDEVVLAYEGMEITLS
ncbi:MAG: MBL fold metallo-hydrolase [Acidimicrobiia bacterium]